ncbi:hypothetical protein ACTXG7_00145 [Mycolicibacterium sp. Dal123E01]|uniref:hypothetical protein n=1 Tax=Mycolicibacterium sp. Dal123E01 TaxID=3457578 RepID=UPI00403EEDEA
MMSKAFTGFVGTVLIAGAVALAGPAAADAPPSLVAANADSKGAEVSPGSLGSASPKTSIAAQDAAPNAGAGARTQTTAVQGQVRANATDGTTTMSTVATPQT